MSPPGAARAALLLVVLLPAVAARAVDLDGPLGRWSAGGFAEGLTVFRTDRDTPRQRPQGILGLKLTDDIRHVGRLHLDLRAIFGGPPEHAGGAGVPDLSHVFQNVSPAFEVDEAYFDARWRQLDVRLGKQKFYWGRLDRFSPTDVLTPRRWTDPFLTDEKDAKIGVPAVQASWFPPDPAPLASDVKVGLAWIPVPVAPRFPLGEQRWFPPAVSVVDAFAIPEGTLFGLPSPRLRIGLVTRDRPMPAQLDEGGVGLRVTGLSGPVDWGLCYYDGPETVPVLDLDIAATAPRVRRKLARGETPVKPELGKSLGDLSLLDVRAGLSPRHSRIRLAGGDAAFRLGGFTARLEAAWGMDRAVAASAGTLVAPEHVRRFVRQNLDTLVARLMRGRAVRIPTASLFADRDLVQWGAGVDYMIDGWLPLLQVDQTVLLDNDRLLLLNDVDTRLLFVLRKAFLGERLGTEAGVVQEIERGYTSVITRLSYEVTDHVRVQVGYLMIAGTRRSYVGQYHDNDEGFARVRVAY